MEHDSVKQDSVKQDSVKRDSVKRDSVKQDGMKLVTFRVGDALFAADIHSVERVLRYTPPAPVPDAPAWVEGVIDYAGRVIPVIDLRRRMSLERCPVTPETRTVVFGTSDGLVGAIVDMVLAVTTVSGSSVTPPPPLFRGLAARFISGVTKVNGQLVVVLDADQVLTSADRLQFERAMGDDPGAAARG